MNESAPEPGPESDLQPAVRALLVDDSLVAITVLSHLLRRLVPIRIVGVAANGQDALALAAQLKPDLVITDIQMPGLDGFQLVRLLRHQFPSVRCVVVSVWDGPAFDQASLHHGADAFINKSRLYEELPNVISRLFPRPVPHIPALVHPNCR